MKLFSNSLYTLLASVIPLLIAIITVPLYLEVVGIERYGLLAIAWLLLGYFGQADLGFGRAMTQRIASLPSVEGDAIIVTFWSGMASLALVGVLASFVLFLSAQAYIIAALEVDPPLRKEMLDAIWLLALTVPLVALGGGLSGALLGVQKFRAVSLVNLINGSSLLVVPLLAAQFIEASLPVLFAAALVSRLAGTLLLAAAVVHSLRPGWPCPSRAEVGALTRFGAWIMVTALVGPLMTASDRFVIGGLAGAAAVAAYSIPYQLANRTLVFPMAIGQVLFPHFAAHEDDRSREDCRTLSIFIGQIFAIPIIILIILADPLFKLWLGDQLDYRSVQVCIILLVGFWFNAVAFVPFSYIQAKGDSRFTALLHLAELPFYFAILFTLGTAFGLPGIAAAFSVRCFADCALLFTKARCADPKSIMKLGFSFSLILGAVALTRIVTGWEWQLATATCVGAVALVSVLFLMPVQVSSKLGQFPMLRWLS